MSHEGTQMQDEQLNEYELEVLREDAIGRSLEILLIQQAEGPLSLEEQDGMDQIRQLDRKLAENRQSDITRDEMIYMRRMTDGCPTRLSRKLEGMISRSQSNPSSSELLKRQLIAL